MKQYLSIILLLVLVPLVFAQQAAENQLRLWSDGDWYNDVCRSGTCAAAYIEWNPNNFRLSKFIVDNGHPYSVAVEITFADNEVLTLLYPNGYYEQTMTGNVNRYVELTPYPDGSVEIEFIGISSMQFLTCSTDCGGDASKVFSLPPGQR